MQLSIIIINFQKKELTLRCLTSILTQYEKELQKKIIEIIILDNNSSDDSVAFLKEEIKKNNFPNTVLITNSENVGFGKGNNLAAAIAKGKYLLFLNNDTVVKDKGFIEMVDYLDKHPQIAIMGGKLYNLDGSAQPSTGKFYTPLYIIFLLLGLENIGLLNNPPSVISEVDWVKGALFMIRKEVFQELDGFDKNIFMYTEDMELCFRAKKAGYKVFFYPHINITHSQQGSSNRTFAIVNIYKNLLYFYKKHKSGREYIFVKFMLAAKAHLLLFYGKMTHNSYLINTYAQALGSLR